MLESLQKGFRGWDNMDRVLDIRFLGSLLHTFATLEVVGPEVI